MSAKPIFILIRDICNTLWVKKPAPKAQTKKFANAFVSFEGPFPKPSIAKQREVQLAEELRNSGKDGLGGH